MNLLKKNENLKIVTFAHHPPSWLKWEEQYSEKDDSRNFNTLLELTSILVTGHIHNPVPEPSIIQNACYHINNGVFLDYHFIDNDSNKDNPISIFPNNWFNVLDVDGDGFSLQSYKFKSEKKTASRALTFNYLWINESPKVSYSFGYIKKAQSTKREIVSQVSSSQSEFNSVGIKSFCPQDLNHLINLLKDRRDNTFSNPDQKNLKISEINILNFNNDKYLIIINKLDEMHRIIDTAKSYQDLKRNKMFNRILENIQENKDSLPVLAFYDFIKSVNPENSAYYEGYQQGRFVLFQSFKHKFFGNFPELYKFTELNIVYNTIIEQ